jgi:hypothetical protein
MNHTPPLPIALLALLAAGCEGPNPHFQGPAAPVTMHPVDAGPPSDAGAQTHGEGPHLAPADGRADAAPPMARPDAGGPVVPGGAPGVPTIVAVGLGGLRVRSRDLGLTWGDRVVVAGDKDANKLYGIHHVDGVYYALGWRLFSSRDGATWTELRNPLQQWFGTVVRAGGWLVAAGGYGRTIRSQDGITWMVGGAAGTDPLVSLASGDGKIAAAGRTSAVYVSADFGQTFTAVATPRTDHVAFCGGQFRPGPACGALPPYTYRGPGIWIRIENDGSLSRSQDGQTWTPAYKDTLPLWDVAFEQPPG